MSEGDTSTPYSLKIVFCPVKLQEIIDIGFQCPRIECPAEGSENKTQQEKPEGMTEQPYQVAKSEGYARKYKCVLPVPPVS